MTAEFNAGLPVETSDRRHFLKKLGVVGAVLSSPELLPTTAVGQAALTGSIARRPFGRTGVPVCILGVGGHAIGQCKTEAEGVRIVQEALDEAPDAYKHFDERDKGWTKVILHPAGTPKISKPQSLQKKAGRKEALHAH